MTAFDRRDASVEGRQERLVDPAEEEAARRIAADAGDAPDGQAWGLSDPELGDGMQVRSDDDELSEAVEDWVAVRDDDLVDALSEAFNARDLDGVHDLTTPNCEVPGLVGTTTTVDPALAELWERRPSILMTRAVDDDHALGVLWERADSRHWSAIGTLHVDAVDERAQVLEFSDDLALLERLDPVAPDADDAFWPDADGLDAAPS